MGEFLARLRAAYRAFRDWKPYPAMTPQPLRVMPKPVFPVVRATWCQAPDYDQN